MTPLRFGGSFFGLVGLMLRVLVPFAAAICLMLFGLAGFRIFLASVVFIPVILLGAFVIARVDWLAFDYDDKVWRRPLRRPIANDSIASVHLVESLGLVQATAKTHSGSSELLLVGLPASRLRQFVSAIENNSRTAQVHVRRISGYKPAVVLAAVVLVPFAAMVFYVRHQNTATAVACISAEWPRVPVETVSQQLGQAAFPLPAGFQLTQRQPGLLGFRHTDGATLTVAVGNQLQPGGAAGEFFLKTAGFDTEYDLYHYACCTRLGMIPLLLKGVILGNSGNPTLTHYHRRGTSALVIQTDTARILTAVPPLHIILSSPRHIDEILSAVP